MISQNHELERPPTQLEHADWPTFAEPLDESLATFIGFGSSMPRADYSMTGLWWLPGSDQLSHVTECIESPQRCLAETFCTAFSFGAAATFNGLAVGFEPPVDQSPATDDDPFGKMFDPMC